MSTIIVGGPPRVAQSESAEALRAMVASFEAQLAALYEEREQAADPVRFRELERENAALRTTVASFEQQLAALHDEKR